MVQSSVPKYALIRSDRSVIKSIARKVFKELGITGENIIGDESPSDLLDHLQANPQTFMIVDWNLGPQHIVPLIKSSQHSILSGLTPVILIASELSADILGYGDEMSVSRVHSGDISASSLKVLIQDVLSSWQESSSTKDALKELNHIREEESSEAVQEFLRGKLEELPDANVLKMELAQELMLSGSFTDALEILLPMKDINPIPCRAINLLGRCQLMMGEHEQATKTLESARLINPFNVDRLILLGKTYLKLDDIDHSRERFDEALSIDPNGKDAVQGKGTIMLLDGEINEGLQLMQQASSKQELASIFNTAAVISIRHKQYDQGLKLYDTAMKACEGEQKTIARLHFNKGLGYYKFRKKNAAIDEFELAIQLDPDHEDARHNLEALKKGATVKPQSDGDVLEQPLVKTFSSFDDEFDDSFDFDD